MRILIIAMALLPTVASIAAAARPDGAPRPNNEQGNYRPLTPREASVDYGGCNQVRQRGLAPCAAASRLSPVDGRRQ